MAVAVRKLGPGDAAALRALNAVFAAAFEDRDTYLGAPPADAYIARLLAQAHFGAFVAEQDVAVVGGLTCYLLDKAERQRCEGYIYDLAVAAAHRRQGIARALIAAACAWAGGQGAHVVFVQADRTDDPAIALYTSLGSREDVLHFDLPVVAGRPSTGSP